MNTKYTIYIDIDGSHAEVNVCTSKTAMPPTEYQTEFGKRIGKAIIEHLQKEIEQEQKNLSTQSK